MTDKPTTWIRREGYEDITYETSGDGIAKISIARPEVHNAFDDALIAALTRGVVFQSLIEPSAFDLERIRLEAREWLVRALKP